MSLDKVIVIVGASSGIGAGLARYLSDNAKAHAKKLGLVLVARRENELNLIAKTINNDYCSTLTIPTDVTKRENVEKILHETTNRFKTVTCWINNVGLGISRSVLELTDDDVDIIMSVNVKTALYGMQVAIPYFRQQGYGHLINISSVLGRMPYTAIRAMYSAAKAALNSLTANLRMELQADPRCENIHVTTILPGLVMTDFSTNAIGDAAPKSFSDYKIPFIGPFPRTAQTVDEVSKIICDVINNEHPPREVYTNPAHGPLINQYFENVENFELLLKPPL